MISDYIPHSHVSYIHFFPSLGHDMPSIVSCCGVCWCFLSLFRVTFTHAADEDVWSALIFNSRVAPINGSHTCLLGEPACPTATSHQVAGCKITRCRRPLTRNTIHDCLDLTSIISTRSILPESLISKAMLEHHHQTSLTPR